MANDLLSRLQDLLSSRSDYRGNNYRRSEDSALESLGGGLDVLNPFKYLSAIPKALKDINDNATNINNVFGQTRQRVIEIGEAFANAIPSVVRLGGSVSDTAEIIEDAALAQRRNVLINEEEISKLYAANKLLNISTKDLVDNFSDVGISVAKIGSELENSINHIRSLGGNTSQIMSVVNTNLKELNRYQFQDGVLGLTKMATQATMLRYDMSETFKLSEDLFKPERAVEVASAFQRLGVSVGSLADPFQLMNQSIMDPSGLQDSLIELAKNFVSFNDETKSFNLSPQGVLTLKELNSQLGISFDNLSKTALAAADLDRKISSIEGVGLNIKEDDKEYLANILRMTETGEYSLNVKVDDQYRPMELSKITQKQLDELITEQKDGPKTLEDISRSQLRTSELLRGDVKAVQAAILYGVATPTPLREGLEDFRQEAGTMTGILSDKASTEYFRDYSNKMIESSLDLIVKLIDTKFLEGELPDIGSTSEIGRTIVNTFSKISTDFMQYIGTSLSDYISSQPTNNQFFEDIRRGMSTNINLSENNNVSGNYDRDLGVIDENSRTLNLDGNVTINLNTPDFITNETDAELRQKFQQWINDLLRDSSFFDTIRNNLNTNEIRRR